MPYTRTQANALLTQAEMKLFDDSRANPVRKLDGKALASRVERTRKLRDKARDQLQRQKLASRSRTGSKRGTSGDANRRSKEKAELLADILKRFEVQAKAAGRQARAAGAAGRKKAPAKKAAAGKPATASKAGSKKAVAKKGPATKGAAKKRVTTKAGAGKAAVAKSAAARKPATGKAAARKAEAKGSAAKPATSRTPAAAKPPAREASAAGSKPQAGATATTRRPARARKAPISPEQALANTRALLEAKKRHDREGPAWQHIDGAASPAAGPYQSPEARARAAELHAGESRMTAIEGSISTRERKNQAKRDKR